MTTRTITFNGVNSATHGVYVGAQEVFDAPKRDVTLTSIAGRNGDLLIDNGRFENIDINYKAVCPENFTTKADDIKAWLLAPTGYCRIEDDRFPNEYRLGVFKDGLKFSTGTWNKNATFDLTFDCKPQRFLTSGETWTDMGDATTSAGSGWSTFTNPTAFASIPKMQIIVRWNGGVMTANDFVKVSINTAQSSLATDFILKPTSTTYSGNCTFNIDFETMTITKNNANVTFTTENFDKKEFKGSVANYVYASISGSGQMTTVSSKVQARWWRV